MNNMMYSGLLPQLGEPMMNFLLGFLAAASVEAYRLQLAMRSGEDPGSSALLSPVIALAGGLLALTLPEVTPIAAVYIGFSAPSVVATAARRLDKSEATGRSPGASEEGIRKVDVQEVSKMSAIDYLSIL